MEPVQPIGDLFQEPLLSEVQDYLGRYGYIGASALFSTTSTEDASGPVVSALRRFQEFYGIQGDTEADRSAATLEALRRPRCGVPDLRNGKKKRGCPWPVGRNVLVYDFGTGPVDIDPPNAAFDQVERAIEAWNRALAGQGIPLQLQKRADEPDDQIHVHFSWVSLGNELSIARPPVALADFPPKCGLRSRGLPRPVWFDQDREWSVDHEPPRLRIVAVAAHEIGHILGLAHSRSQSSVMYSDSGQGIDSPSADDEIALAQLYAAHRAAIAPGVPVQAAGMSGPSVGEEARP